MKKKLYPPCEESMQTGTKIYVECKAGESIRCITAVIMENKVYSFFDAQTKAVEGRPIVVTFESVNKEKC
jgi:hypothetical protein